MYIQPLGNHKLWIVWWCQIWPCTSPKRSKEDDPPGGWFGNMLAWHAVNPGSIPGLGIHSDLDDHYNGGPVSLDAQWHVKGTSRCWLKVISKLIGQKVPLSSLLMVLEVCNLYIKKAISCESLVVSDLALDHSFKVEFWWVNISVPLSYYWF